MELQDTLSKKGRNLATYDFSTLYTSIPHEKLKENLNRIVTRAFKGMKKKYIVITNYSAKWATKEGKGTLIDCDLLIEMINWLIDNTYVTIGIPMGTDCAPYLANLFLFSYEFDFLYSILKQKDFATLYKFNKCYRYIDDLLAINNDGIMEDFKNTIYPPELKLNCEDKNDQEVHYLDLSLDIKHFCIQYQLSIIR